MGSSSDEILKPLRVSCGKIESGESAERHLEDVKKFASKGAYYQYHVVVELLGILERKPSLDTKTTAEIFKIVGENLHDGNGDKKSLLAIIYNFLAKMKVRKIRKVPKTALTLIAL